MEPSRRGDLLSDDMDRDELSNNSSATPAGIYPLNYVRYNLPTISDFPTILEARTNNRRLPFSQFFVDKTKAVPPNCYFILLGFLAKLATDVTSGWINFCMDECGASNGTPKVVLNFSEAFPKFLGVIEHVTMFIMIYAAAQSLTLLHSQLLAGTLVSLAPFYYFPQLLAKAPNFSVNCGTFELPIFCFVFLCAFVCSLLQCFVVLLVLFISWRKLMRCDWNEVPTIPSNTGNEVPTITYNNGDSNDTSNEEEMEETLQVSTGDMFEIEGKLNPVQPNEVV